MRSETDLQSKLLAADDLRVMSAGSSSRFTATDRVGSLSALADVQS
ncbi:hypothetical protein ABN034_28945 [Actinopolymorpha sp. B11F2]